VKPRISSVALKTYRKAAGRFRMLDSLTDDTAEKCKRGWFEDASDLRRGLKET